MLWLLSCLASFCISLSLFFSVSLYFSISVSFALTISFFLCVSIISFDVSLSILTPPKESTSFQFGDYLYCFGFLSHQFLYIYYFFILAYLSLFFSFQLLDLTTCLFITNEVIQIYIFSRILIWIDIDMCTHIHTFILKTCYFHTSKILFHS